LVDGGLEASSAEMMCVACDEDLQGRMTFSDFEVAFDLVCEWLFKKMKEMCTGLR
jgi:hypothetical protein